MLVGIPRVNQLCNDLDTPSCHLELLEGKYITKESRMTKCLDYSLKVIVNIGKGGGLLVWIQQHMT